MTRLIPRFRPRTGSRERPGDNGVSHVRVMRAARHPVARTSYVVTAAESAPCTCPDFCERDHANE
jgi:hypothetical protein